MKISRRRELKVRMGQFENHTTAAWVEIDTKEDVDELKSLGVDPADQEDVVSFLNEMLDDLLADEVADAQAYTDDEDSFIHPYLAYKDKQIQKRKG